MGRANLQTLSNLRVAQTNRLESLGELASGIAHEINTPAQYVGDNLRFLQNEFTNLLRLVDQYRAALASTHGAESALRDDLAALERSVDFEFLRREIPQALCQSLEGLERVRTIVRAMKDFAYAGGSAMEAADLRVLVASTVEVCRSRWKQVAELQTEFESDLPLVPCLVSELNQVILNLIVNAADAIADRYEPGGSARGTITISLRRVQEQVELRIADDGAGISDDAKARLFEPFFTTKPMGKGTGQGLRLCRDVVVDHHGGTIDVESRVGVGTCFVVRLPLHQPAQSDVEAA